MNRAFNFKMFKFDGQYRCVDVIPLHKAFMYKKQFKKETLNRQNMKNE